MCVSARASGFLSMTAWSIAGLSSMRLNIRASESPGCVVISCQSASSGSSGSMGGITVESGKHSVSCI